MCDRARVECMGVGVRDRITKVTLTVLIPNVFAQFSFLSSPQSCFLAIAMTNQAMIYAKATGMLLKHAPLPRGSRICGSQPFVLY